MGAQTEMLGVGMPTTLACSAAQALAYFGLQGPPPDTAAGSAFAGVMLTVLGSWVWRISLEP